MFSSPSIHEIVQAAASLGIHLDPDEACIYQEAAAEQLSKFQTFLDSPLDDEPPVSSYPHRALGHRPSRSEDPYRAWLWKCSIGGQEDGRLAGRTVSFKDHVSVAGIPQSLTSQAMENFIPSFDATVVSRVLDAGACVIGKNMMSGFMGDYGLPANPFDVKRSAGGSSSGSAVALAAEEVDISFGGDQGGSIRIPAAYCGVVGLKPTFGLVSHFGVAFGSEQSVDHVGPMARTVEDVAIALEVVAGWDGNDPRQGRDVPEKIDVVGGLDDGVKGLRVGILSEGFAEPIDEMVHEAVLEAVGVMAAAGAEVSWVSIPEHERLENVYAALAIEGSKIMTDSGLHGAGFKTYYPAGVSVAVDRMWRHHADMFPPGTKLSHIVAALSRSRYYGAVYAKAHNVRPAFVRAYDEALKDVDVIAMPTVRSVAPLLEEQPTDHLSAVAKRLRDSNWMYLPYTYNTKPASYTGHPALAIPCGKVDGLPVSLQLIGRFFDDAVLLKAAYSYQQGSNWAGLAGA